jgi:hypothetical protein
MAPRLASICWAQAIVRIPWADWVVYAAFAWVLVLPPCPVEGWEVEGDPPQVSQSALAVSWGLWIPFSMSPAVGWTNFSHRGFQVRDTCTFRATVISHFPWFGGWLGVFLLTSPVLTYAATSTWGGRRQGFTWESWNCLASFHFVAHLSSLPKHSCQAASQDGRIDVARVFWGLGNNRWIKASWEAWSPVRPGLLPGRSKVPRQRAHNCEQNKNQQMWVRGWGSGQYSLLLLGM